MRPREEQSTHAPLNGISLGLEQVYSQYDPSMISDWSVQRQSPVEEGDEPVGHARRHS